MFIIQSSKPSYCGHTFASSSCHTEYDGKVEAALQTKTALGGLLKRTSSHRQQSIRAFADQHLRFRRHSGLCVQFFHRSLRLILLMLASVLLSQTTLFTERVVFFIELNFDVKYQQHIFVRVETPCGEHGTLEFTDGDVEQVFRPMQHGCGNGVWKIDVIDESETVLSSLSMPINGVGILYFEIGNDMCPSLIGKEFLHKSGACRKHRV
ncbi:hypothetical protein OSTOST_02857 [Ostertagia ostertagi]